MNIFVREVKNSAASMIYWTLAMIFFIFMFMLMYPSLSQETAILEKVFDSFPVELRRALGISMLNLSSLLGFYGFIFIYVLLIGSIYAMKSGISILSEELRSRTADFLLVKPVSRTTIVSAKALTVLFHLVVQNILFMLFSFLIVRSYNNASLHGTTFLLINLSLFQVQLFFAALGLFLAVIMKRIKTVLPITLGVVFGFFVIQMINQSLNDPKLAYITPFSYFDVARIIQNAGYDLSFLSINLLLVFLWTVLTYFIYLKKDMPSV